MFWFGAENIGPLSTEEVQLVDLWNKVSETINKVFSESIFESPRSFRETVGACLKNRGLSSNIACFMQRPPGFSKDPGGFEK